MIEVGNPFPEFALKDQDGTLWLNEKLLGKKTVIYFYPKDDTSGCTIEACEFRDLMPTLKGVQILGVSPDSEKSHQKFIGKFNLNFSLLADIEHELADRCGIWVEKSMYGKKYMGVERTTYLLDESGTVINVWRKVKPEGHAAEVQAAIG